MNRDRYEPYSVVVDDADRDYEDWVLDKVVPFEDGRGWEVGCRGTVCVVPKLVERTMTDADHREIEPKVGDPFRVYGSIGRPIAGQVLNRTVIWYRDQNQRAERRRRDLADMEASRQRKFAIEQVELEMRYARLPESFQRRLDRFRGESPRFRVESESYESFCLEQAALLAEHFGSEEKVREWAAIKDYEEQMAVAPTGWSDGHSNNTYGAAVRFSIALIRGEDV